MLKQSIFTSYYQYSRYKGQPKSAYSMSSIATTYPNVAAQTLLDTAWKIVS